MAGVRRLESITLRVTDLEAASSFYRDVLGLVELGRDDAVYLGCGLDGNADLALVEGGTGVERFTLRAVELPLDTYEDRLMEAGIAVEDADSPLPGQGRRLAFELPGGRLSMAIAEVEETRYHNAADPESLPTAAGVNPDRSPIAPVDLSHITAMTPDLEGDVTFCQDVLGLTVSDAGRNPPGDLVMAFMRAGDYHHDVALFADPEHSLHHVALEVADVSQLVRCLDRVAAAGIELQAGPVRHGPGSNIAAYFMSPGGNRVELATELQTVGPDAPMTEHGVEEVPFNVWGGAEPDAAFREGT